MGVRVTPNLDTFPSLEIHPRPKKQSWAAVAFNGQNHQVVWSDMTIDTTTYYIVGARVSPSGTILDPQVVISTALGISDGNNAAIEYDGARCLVVWNTDAGTIFGRFLNLAGRPDGSIFLIPNTNGWEPDMAFDGTNYLVVWNTSTIYDINGQLVSPQGQAVGTTIPIGTGPQAQLFPSVAYDGQKYLVMWRQLEGTNRLICGQFVSKTGSLIGGNFTISDVSTSEKWYAVAAASDRNYLVAWHVNSGTGTDIYGNVDVNINAIQEQDFEMRPRARAVSVLRGGLDRYLNKEYEVFDIRGRCVATRGAVGPGVYFIVSNQAGVHERQKIVVIR